MRSHWQNSIVNSLIDPSQLQTHNQIGEVGVDSTGSAM